MLIELGTDRLSNLKRRALKTVQGTVAGILSFAGTYGISPNIVHAEPPAQSAGISRTINPPEVKQVLDYIPTYSLDPYTQCGGEGYLDNETVLITPQEDEITLVESLGIIPGECGNPEELALQPQPTPTPEPVPTPVPTATGTPIPPMPTKTPIPVPPPPKSPVPLPTVSNVQKLPQIKGDATCIDQTNRALNLLREKSPIHYNLAITYISVGECIGDGDTEVFPEETPPRAVFDRLTRAAGSIWYGAAWVHEGCHSWQYQRYYALYPSVPFRHMSDESLRELEIECGEVSYDVLTRLGADQQTLKYLRELINKGAW